jgi:hypothetical protein
LEPAGRQWLPDPEAKLRNAERPLLHKPIFFCLVLYRETAVLYMRDARSTGRSNS